MPSDNSTDLGANQVSGLEQLKDGHPRIYSPVLLYPGLNTDVISEGWFQLLLQDLSVSNIDDYIIKNFILTIFTGKYGYLAYGQQDNAYLPTDNNTDLRGIPVPGLEQHNDGHIHIYPLVTLYPELNTDFVSERRFQVLLQDLSAGKMDDYRYGMISRSTTLTGNTDILPIGHRTAPT